MGERLGQWVDEHLLLLGEDGRVVFARALHASDDASAPDLSASGTQTTDTPVAAARLQVAPEHVALPDFVPEVPVGARVLLRGPLARAHAPVALADPDADAPASADGPLTTQARRLHAVGAAAGVLTSSLQLDQLLEHIVDYATLLFDVPAASVLLPAAGSPRGPFWSAASVGLDPRVEGRGIRSDTLGELGLDTPVPLLLADLEGLRSVPFFQELVAEGFRCALSLPLATDEGLHGLLLIIDRRPISIGRVDLESFKLFATHAANALRNVEHHEADRRTAEVLRQAVLAVAEDVDGVATASRYYSATSAEGVGGDFYDVFPTIDARVAVTIGDVSGKGLATAGTTTLTKHAIQAYARLDPDPGHVLALANDLLCDRPNEMGFVTVGFAVFDPGSRRLAYALAGHLPFLLKQGREVRALELHAYPLGALSGTAYHTGLTTLRQEEILLGYTDGVTEARRGSEFFGEERLRAAVSAAGGTVDEVVGAVARELQEFTRGRLRDDACFFAVSFPGVPAAPLDAPA